MLNMHATVSNTSPLQESAISKLPEQSDDYDGINLNGIIGVIAIVQ